MWPVWKHSTQFCRIERHACLHEWNYPQGMNLFYTGKETILVCYRKSSTVVPLKRGQYSPKLFTKDTSEFARQGGDMGCLLGVETLIDIPPQLLQWCVQYHATWDRVILSLNCMNSPRSVRYEGKIERRAVLHCPTKIWISASCDAKCHIFNGNVSSCVAYAHRDKVRNGRQKEI